MSNKSVKKSAKQIAISDIKAELSKEGKCFIAFRADLSPAINQIVKEQVLEQLRISKSDMNISR